MSWVLLGTGDDPLGLYGELLDEASQADSGVIAYERMAEALRQALPDYHTDHMYAAAELLLWAVDMPGYDAAQFGQLDRTVLDILAAKRVPVGGVLESTGPTPDWQRILEEQAEDGDEQAREELEAFITWDDCIPSDNVPSNTRFIDWFRQSPEFSAVRLFLWDVRYLAESLRSRKPSDKGGKPSLALRGIAPERLIGSCGGLLVDSPTPFDRSLVPPIKEEPDDHAAWQFECEVIEDPEFQQDIAHLQADLERRGIRQWTYSYSDGRLVDHGQADADKPSAGMFAGVVCSKWCMESLSTESGSTLFESVWVTARRLRVVASTTGTSVFIPRYYKYSNLQDRLGRMTKNGPRPTDFVPMKRAMDSFPSIRLQRSVKSKVRMAKRIRARALAEGKSKHDAWEEARVAAGLSTDQMEEHLGPQPRK